MADSADVLAIVVVGVVIFLLFFSPLGDILAGWFGWNEPANSWSANVYGSPIAGGVTQPSGNVTVAVGDSLTIYAVGVDGWTFKEWTINDYFFSSSPETVVPSYDANVSVDIVAHFEVLTEVFRVAPDLSVTKGSTSSGTIYFYNDGDATIKDFKVKLNDPYNIFTSFQICNTYYMSHGGIGAPSITYKYASCLNAWSTVLFPRNSEGTYRTSIIPALGNGYTYIKYTTSANAGSGIYDITFDIQFSVVSGEFNYPPNVVIPWRVQILG